MRKYLHFVCPTDHLESVIKYTYKGDHFFLSSLGNSETFDTDSLRQIKKMLEIHDIRQIIFVLSDNNRIVRDALNKQNISKFEGLQSLSKQVIEKKENCELRWQTYDLQFLILSWHLHNKVQSLQYELEEEFHDQLIIQAKIYKRRENTFCNIYSDLIFREDFSLN